MNAKFSSLLMECNSHLFGVLLCLKYLCKGEGGSSGSLLSLCLGEPEDGVVWVFLFLIVSPCLLVVLYMLYSENIVYKKKKRKKCNNCKQ